MDRKLDTSTVARRLGVSPRQVRNMAAAGRFPGAYNAGAGRRRNWRIPESALEGLVATPEPQNLDRATTREGDGSGTPAEQTEQTEETEEGDLRRGSGVGQLGHVWRGSPLRSNDAVNPRPSLSNSATEGADGLSGAGL